MSANGKTSRTKQHASNFESEISRVSPALNTMKLAPCVFDFELLNESFMTLLRLSYIWQVLWYSHTGLSTFS